MWLRKIGDHYYYYYPKTPSSKCLFRLTPSQLGTEHWYLRHILLNIVIPTAPEGTEATSPPSMHSRATMLSNTSRTACPAHNHPCRT